MPLTVGQYAIDRGYSRTAIYKAIDRSPEIQNLTYKGISKGKETLFISDEGIELLDANLQPSQKSNDALKKNLELAIRDRENQLITEKNEIVNELTTKLTTISDQLHREKEEEMTITRNEMISRVENVGSDVREALGLIRDNYVVNLCKLEEKIQVLENKIQALETENTELREVNNRLKTNCQQLTSSLQFAQAHPVKFMIASKDQQLPGAEK